MKAGFTNDSPSRLLQPGHPGQPSASRVCSRVGRVDPSQCPFLRYAQDKAGRTNQKEESFLTPLTNVVQHARERAQVLIAAYQPPEVPAEVRQELKAVMTRAAKRYGMEELPSLPGP